MEDLDVTAICSGTVVASVDSVDVIDSFHDLVVVGRLGAGNADKCSLDDGTFVDGDDDDDDAVGFLGAHCRFSALLPSSCASMMTLGRLTLGLKNPAVSVVDTFLVCVGFGFFGMSSGVSSCSFSS